MTTHETIKRPPFNIPDNYAINIFRLDCVLQSNVKGLLVTMEGIIYWIY